MIAEDYVSFETAQLLRVNGFDELTAKSYPVFENKEYKYDISCPTLQMAMKWLRDEYHLFIWISCKPGTSMPYYYEVFKTDKTKEYVVHIDHNVYGSYEKLCDDAIQYCLKNLI